MVDESPDCSNGLADRVDRIRAAEYVRMSTEHQRYSIENQTDAIRQFAAARGVEIVKTYADAGKSGLRIDGRQALQRLIADVQGRDAGFQTILVYDVSRWGRFQDADESAYYEYICKRAGITVQYCAEQFENDGTPLATIIKGIKRAMAGEYSRELSTKVFAGQCRLIELGFRQGGRAGYGLRRFLIDETGRVKGELARHKQKSIQTDRVVLGLGPPEEVAIIREIFRLFVNELRSERSIAADLNARGIAWENGRPWTRDTVHEVLVNEKYVGHNVWNRVSFKLSTKRIRNSPDKWIRADDAFPPVVDGALFLAAQMIIKNRSLKASDEEMLDALRTLHARAGRLSHRLLKASDGVPSSVSYRTRFGGLLQAYGLIGYTPDRDYQFMQVRHRLHEIRRRILSEIITGLSSTGSIVARQNANVLVVNGELTISVTIVHCRKSPCGSSRWFLRVERRLRSDITIAVRMDAANCIPLDYFVFPKLDLMDGRLYLNGTNCSAFNGYRFDTLDKLYTFLAPTSLMEAA